MVIFLRTLEELGYEVEWRRRVPGDYLWARKTTETTMANSWVDADRMKLCEAVLEGRPREVNKTPGVGIHKIGGGLDREW
jgi:hypothetical protein